MEVLPCLLVLCRINLRLRQVGSGHAYASVFLKLREDIEFEVEVAEFDKASEPLSETNQPIIDPDYPHEEDPDWKLKHFRKLEKILKEEGLLD
jgi:hypothetical protein